jgi:hypothetical protein
MGDCGWMLRQSGVRVGRHADIALRSRLVSLESTNRQGCGGEDGDGLDLACAKHLQNDAEY